jgi:ribosome biogenesis GTPase / thiamine phosphate phosphatase
MKIEEFGYNNYLEKMSEVSFLSDFETGRVLSEHKERYLIVSNRGEIEAEITGRLRFTSNSREDFPAVGDWVALTIHDSNLSIIHSILPRFSVISRKAVGKIGEIQIIASNIDYAFLVQSVDRNFNINRLERYLLICNASNVSPIIVLTKIDLIDNQNTLKLFESIKSRLRNVPIISLSNKSQEGYDKIKAIIKTGKTYCLLGSSGVGKSTLLNNLSGKTQMRTDLISQRTNKGRHVTSHRKLIILENGGILVDNPGMREVGIVDRTTGLEMTFDLIIKYSQDCKFKNCTHTYEKGCSIIEAIEKGEIDEASYLNYLKMEREKSHFESSVVERRKKDKNFGKMIKNYKKNMNKDKY